MQDDKLAHLMAQSVQYMAERGFHAKLIAKETGLSVSQVYYRTGGMGLSLKLYRDGLTVAAKKVIRITPCVSVQTYAEAGKPLTFPKKYKKE